MSIYSINNSKISNAAVILAEPNWVIEEATLTELRELNRKLSFMKDYFSLEELKVKKDYKEMLKEKKTLEESLI